MKRRTPRFYFAFRSPYSWIASRLLKERYAIAFDRIEYIPYWEPDARTDELLRARGGKHLYHPMSKAKHLYILQDVKRLTTKLGYRLAWPIDQEPWWELPHLAYLAARRAGKGQAFIEAIYAARWERGENICAAEVVRCVAGEVGLDAEALLAAPDDESIRVEGVDALHTAYQNDVFGVPFFTLGYEKFWGVDRVEDFVAALEAGEET